MKLFSSAIHYSDPYLKRESLEYSSIRVYEIIALHEYITKVVCVCQYDLIRLFEPPEKVLLITNEVIVRVSRNRH